jgi:hypothetical protein
VLDDYLVNFLKRLDAQLGRSAIVVIIGGNALVLLGYKDLTNDIDVSVPPDDDILRKTHMLKLIFKQTYGLDVDYFAGGMFVNVCLDDYLQTSSPYFIEGLKYIKVRIMHPFDIILTKMDRLNAKDLKDISDFFAHSTVKEFELDARFGYHLSHYKGSDSKKENFIKNYARIKVMFKKRLESQK